MAEEKKEKKPCPPCQLKISNERKKAEEAEDKYLRLATEFENYKKRQKKEIVKLKKLNTKEIMKNLLPFLDALQKTYLAVYGEDGSILVNLDNTLKLLDKFLDEYDVAPFRALGKVFDPKIHKSIGSRITKHPKDVIVEVFREGYMIGDSLLRPADVMLSRKDVK